jgi:hypothetical protein
MTQSTEMKAFLVLVLCNSNLKNTLCTIWEWGGFNKYLSSTRRQLNYEQLDQNALLLLRNFFNFEDSGLVLYI